MVFIHLIYYFEGTSLYTILQHFKSKQVKLQWTPGIRKSTIQVKIRSLINNYCITTSMQKIS